MLAEEPRRLSAAWVLVGRSYTKTPDMLAVRSRLATVSSGLGGSVRVSGQCEDIGGLASSLLLGQHVANLRDVTHAKLAGVVAQEEAGIDVRRRSEIGQQGELVCGAGVRAGDLHGSHFARVLSQSY